MKKILLFCLITSLILACKESKAPAVETPTKPVEENPVEPPEENPTEPTVENPLKPTFITETTPYDTDDPAIWVHPEDPSRSLIVGTDKEEGGGLYLYNLEGKIVGNFPDMRRPNNVDVAYGMNINGTKTDIAVVTERNANSIRIFSLPNLSPIDNGGIPIFKGESGEGERDGMGVALYTKRTGSDATEIYAIVGRKAGPSGRYLWQYRLFGNPDGTVGAEVVRKFGTYSGKKEIEAIAVDNELGYVYYSDETAGVRKYYADPDKGNDELAFFSRQDAKGDHEGIAIYKKDSTTGYILVSNQQNNTFLVYKREGDPHNPHNHALISEVPVSTIECDGADAANVNFGAQFPDGILIAMSNGRVFHVYDWRKIQDWIDINPIAK